MKPDAAYFRSAHSVTKRGRGCAAGIVVEIRQTARVDDLAAGLYEVLVDEALAARLSDLDERLVDHAPLRPADAADRIALHLARQIERAVDSVPESDRVTVGVEIAGRLLEELMRRLPRAEAATELPVESGRVLRAVNTWRPDGSVRKAQQPLIPLLDTTLLTNAPGAP